MGGGRRWLLVALAALVALVAVGYGVLAASTSQSQLARAVLWGESDVDDHRRFPARRIAAGPNRFHFRRPPGTSVPPVPRIQVQEGSRLVERDLEPFLVASGTTAFLIVRGDTLVYEGYFNGAGPFGDDTATYYAPDLRKLALEQTEVVEAPGRRFRYNNFNPLLVGLALERAVGTPVAAYLESRLWRPLGMEAAGSWSLDSQASGFEKMESGLNARAVDFARLGLLVARDGAWRGRQLVPRAWVQDLTLVPTGGSVPAPGYQYFWWVQDQRRPRAQFARGKYGQHLYVVPASDLVLVRFGRDTGYPFWPELLSDLARRLDQPTSGRERSMVGGDRGRRP